MVGIGWARKDNMKTLLIIAILLFSTQALAQLEVGASWDAPTTTMGYTYVLSDTSSIVVPPVPLLNGSLKHYNVFLATPTDTVLALVVPAPVDLTKRVAARIVIPFSTEVFILVSAVDQRDQEGPHSVPSNTLAIYPGPPGEIEDLIVDAVFIVGGP